MSALGHVWTNHRGLKSTVVRYCPKADNFCDAAHGAEGPQPCALSRAASPMPKDIV